MDRCDIATALLRGTHVAASLSLFGCLVFRRFVIPKGAGELPLNAVNRITLVTAILALVVGGVWLAAVSRAIAGGNGVASMAAAVPVVVGHTSFGHFVSARLLLLVGVLVALAFRGSRARIVALIMSGAALALQPMLGHIGVTDGRAALIPIEIAHLLAVGAWLGCLAPLLICVVYAPPSLSAELCNRFTPVGLVAVGTLAVTALPQAGELIGGIPGLFGTQYGRLALVKLGLFLLALGLACVNRLVVTARVGTVLGRRTLLGLIAIEIVAVFAVVLAAGAMASLPPATHVQPVWPFAWRLKPSVGDERLVIAAAFGLALVGISLTMRRFRLLAVVLSVIAMAPFAPGRDALLVRAYPTTYAQSTTGFSVNSIARGGMLFGTWCAVCHEARTGTGSESDLTAPHIWGHLDGELFWWISNGVHDSRGAAVMPGYGSILSEDDRWALIDFIHAWNLGHQTANAGHWLAPVGAPSTPLICADRSADTLADLATHVVIVVVESDPESGGRPVSPGTGMTESSDIVTIHLPRGAAGKPRSAECVAASEHAWEAWRLLAGVATDRFAGSWAIVDARGWLSAWLPPNASPDQIRAAIRDVRDHPIANVARPSHHH